MQLSEDHVRALSTVFEAAKAHFGASELRRVEQTLDVIAGRSPTPPVPDPRQMFGPFSVPGLRSQPWYDPSELPICGVIQSQWRAIRAELLAALERRTGFQFFVSMDAPRVTTPRQWKALYLRDGAIDFRENPALCPLTTSLLDRDPRTHGLALFSALDPGGHIPPHRAPWNARLNVHLALIVPNDCGIRVADETRTWVEGECLLFDETYEHEAWNRGDSTRFILLFNVWHPDLTDAETRVLDLAARIFDAPAEHARLVVENRTVLDGAEWWAP